MRGSPQAPATRPGPTAGADATADLQAALAVALAPHRAPAEPLMRTTRRTLTRRGVLWLGQTCNLKCHFCYFLDRIATRSHPEHPFMSLAKARAICDTLVRVYGNSAVDIQGGEPTIWKPILELVTHCREIGLHPTLITNALTLDRKERCDEFRRAGLRDFLISVQGLGSTHDQIVQRPGAHQRQMRALRNLQELGMRFRFNCVLSKPAVPQLPAMAELAVATGAQVVNFLAFNPFEDQARAGTRSVANVPRYTEVTPRLTEALDLLAAAGIEANVRYYPLCVLPERHRHSVYDFQQLPYDHHEWDYGSWSWTGLQPQRMRDGDLSPVASLSNQRLQWLLRAPVRRLAGLPGIGPFVQAAHGVFGRLLDRARNRERLYRENARVRAELHCRYVYAPACGRCSLRRICDGFHGDYAGFFGVSEAAPVALGRFIDDPTHYIRRQSKIVEPEDRERALAPHA
jgi:pyruvate-formate lyase-activating enzyme